MYMYFSLFEDFMSIIYQIQIRSFYNDAIEGFLLFQTSCIYCSTEVQHELFPARLPLEYLLMREVGCRIPRFRLSSQRDC